MPPLLCATLELGVGTSLAPVDYLRGADMKRNALFALLLSSAMWLGGCSLLHAARPPCGGHSCPSGARGQLPAPTANANNQQPAPAAPAQAEAKNADAPSQRRSLANRLHI